MLMKETVLPDTEQRNDRSMNIDELSVMDMLKVINEEDKKVAFAVEAELPDIAKAVAAAEKALRAGGKVIYCGCGTSGRLGVLDASECPPTYGVDPGLFHGIIAGGFEALVRSAEGAEDDGPQCVADLNAADFTGRDLLIGIAASGRTPYVMAGLQYARSLGAGTVFVNCSKNTRDGGAADTVISIGVGPEAITGSTRMKAGTAQKMALNMISTATMVRLGKVYGNLMVDLKPTNKKLANRAVRIIAEATGCSHEAAADALKRSGNNAKLAIVMVELGIDPPAARDLLAKNGGFIRKALAAGRGETIMG